MKSYREELWFETKTRRAYLNITQQVEAAVKKSGVQEGLVLVNAMHITAYSRTMTDSWTRSLLKARPIGTMRREKITATLTSSAS